MATLDLRSSGGTLHLSPNGGSTTIRPFIGVGPKGDPGTPGTPGTPGSPGAGASGSYPNLARNPELMFSGTVTYDANGAPTSAAVTWPDGTPGTYTADAVSTLSTALGAVDAYHITYGSPVTKTYTQPAVTRNSAGYVTNYPPITAA